MPELGEKIRHVIVLMLENRSFDHMLGHVFNPGQMPVPEPSADFVQAGPDHSHAGVMWQMLGHETALPAPTRPLTMSGFAECHVEKRGGPGFEVLRGFRPEQLPVLSTLAQEFVTCTNWFCSVPGETWPNRNFAHAGTSDGEVNIVPRFYHNDTIFERIEDAGGSWRVYHQGPAQVWCFPALWPRPFHDRFDDHDDLLDDIANDRLPSYAFVEPDHGLVFRDALDSSNSQHPANNVCKQAGDDGCTGRDLLEGERLLFSIYRALRAAPAVFRKTLLIVTYDEHGGFADQVAPPDDALPPGTGRSSSVFAFKLLGPRVPTLLISPWIPRGTPDPRRYDHSAIPRNLRQLFAPKSDPLSDREAAANLFLDNLSLAKARSDLPLPTPRTPVLAASEQRVARSSARLAAPLRELDSFQQSLVDLSLLLDRELRVGRGARTRGATRDALDAAAAPAAREFTTEAERQLYLQELVRRFQKSGRFQPGER